MTVSEPSEVQGERWIVRNGEIRTDGPPYHCVASITITNNDVEHADARARLIAAAPDLLAALESARPVLLAALYMASNPEQKAIKQRILDGVTNAIAKATEQ